MATILLEGQKRNAATHGRSVNRSRLQKETSVTSKKYDEAQAIAATLLEDAVCKKTLEAPNAKIEHSIFVDCPETGLKLRCCPDLYDPDKRAMADIKCTVDPSPEGFADSAINIGMMLKHFSMLPACRMGSHSLCILAPVTLNLIFRICTLCRWKPCSWLETML